MTCWDSVEPGAGEKLLCTFEGFWVSGEKCFSMLAHVFFGKARKDGL